MYPEEDRQVYRYFDGEADVFADPMDLDDKFLIACGGEDIDALFRHMRTDPHSVEPQFRAGQLASIIRPATEAVVAATREAFGIKPPDGRGGGLNKERTLAVLFDFLRWKAAEKNAQGDSPSSSAATDGPPESPGSTIETTAG